MCILAYIMCIQKYMICIRAFMMCIQTYIMCILAYMMCVQAYIIVSWHAWWVCWHAWCGSIVVIICIVNCMSCMPLRKTIMKFGREQLQSHKWLTASSYMSKYLQISSYIRKPFVIYDFATTWISLYEETCWHGVHNAFRLVDFACFSSRIFLYTSGSLPTYFKNQSAEDHERYVLYPYNMHEDKIEPGMLRV
jgi:hypothetical protein